MTKVKQEIIEQIKGSGKAKGRLAYVFAKSTDSIDRWLKNNDIMLTTPMAVKAIAEELEINESEILTEA